MLKLREVSLFDASSSSSSLSIFVDSMYQQLVRCTSNEPVRSSSSTPTYTIQISSLFNYSNFLIFRFLSCFVGGVTINLMQKSTWMACFKSGKSSWLVFGRCALTMSFEIITWRIWKNCNLFIFQSASWSGSETIKAS